MKRIFFSSAILAPLMMQTVTLRAQQSAPQRPSSGEEFFIISSVDLKKQQLVLKRPTEVTELVEVSPETKILNEKGKPLQLKELRAGDTVYVTWRRAQDGTRAPAKIRLGSMTVEQVHRRYLGFASR